MWGHAAQTNNWQTIAPNLIAVSRTRRLGEAGTASPALQEAAAMLVAQMPVADAAAVLGVRGDGVSAGSTGANGRWATRDQ
jgi:hypothetical protein